MLDSSMRGILAQGSPVDLRDNDTDPKVRAFFRREAREVAL